MSDRVGLATTNNTEKFYSKYRKTVAERETLSNIMKELIAGYEPAELIFDDANPESERDAIREAISRANDIIDKFDFDNVLRRPKMMREFAQALRMFGPLAGVLTDPSLSEVMVNGRNEVYVERNGKLFLTEVQFASDDDVIFIMKRMLEPIGRTISDRYPMVDARLPDGSRINCIIPPLSVRGPMITIRKFKADVISVDDLIKLDSLNEAMANLLQIAVRARRNILVCGGTGSGKTTLLNVLGTFIPESERILTLEDAAELKLPHPHLGRLETRPRDMSDTPEIAMRDLVKNALRMRPDRIIVGEVRGDEILDMFQAMNTGHEGSMTTIHANSPRDVFTRMEMMLTMASPNLPLHTAKYLIASSLHLVVALQRFQDGTRRVVAINEITGMEGPTISMAPLFTYKRTGVGKDGKIQGHFESTGYRPRFFEYLEEMGVRIPADASPVTNGTMS